MPINLFLPSLPHIAEEFRVDFAVVNLSIAGFAIAAGAAQLFAGPLSDWYGRRRIALATALIFIAASIGCMLASSFELFLFFRILQSVVVAGYGISLAVISETSKDGEAAGKIGYVATAYAVVPMVGPTLGGGD
jgi:MFS family permease